jgi:hypothetical protein
LIILFGNRKVGNNCGIVTGTLSMPSPNAKALKWVAGILCIWFGVGLLFGGGHM